MNPSCTFYLFSFIWFWFSLFCAGDHKWSTTQFWCFQAVLEPWTREGSASGSTLLVAEFSEDDSSRTHSIRRWIKWSVLLPLDLCVKICSELYQGNEFKFYKLRSLRLSSLLPKVVRHTSTSSALWPASSTFSTLFLALF